MKGCKNCPAYAKCTVTYRGSACAALRGTYGIDRDPEVVTNADRIRAMRDEDLAVFLCSVKFRRESPLNVPDFLYIKDAYDWLQKPAEEDT